MTALLLKPEDISAGIILSEPGFYVLGGSVTFKGTSSSPISCLDARTLQLESAILVIGDAVSLDLGGYEVKMSDEDALLADNAVIRLRAASRCQVQGGHIGRSQHALICEDCGQTSLTNLSLYDFASGGVALRGGKDMRVVNAVIGPSWKCEGLGLQGYYDALYIAAGKAPYLPTPTDEPQGSACVYGIAALSSRGLDGLAASARATSASASGIHSADAHRPLSWRLEATQKGLPYSILLGTPRRRSGVSSPFSKTLE